MKRRGKCRCGAILHFQQTSQGYKTRCGDCGAVVRLRQDAAANAVSEPKKASSAVLSATSGPPPLPTAGEQTDVSAETLVPSVGLDDLPAPPPPDLSLLSEHDSTAPAAVAEIESIEEPAPSGARWWLLGAAALIVIVAVGAVAMIWG